MSEATPQGSPAGPGRAAEEAAGPVGAGDPPPPPVAKASSGEGPPTPPPAVEQVEKDLRELLADAEQKKDEYLELAKRTQADFENYRMRMAAEVQAAALRGKSELAAGIIGVLDTIERALEAAGVRPDAGAPAPEEPLAEGFFLTYRELLAALGRAGIESFEPAGEPFDPTWHEALQKLPKADGVAPGTVVEVVQKGYRLGEQLIRPARVVVSE